MPVYVEFLQPVGGDPNATITTSLQGQLWLCPDHAVVHGLLKRNPNLKVVASPFTAVTDGDCTALPVPGGHMNDGRSSMAKSVAASANPLPADKHIVQQLPLVLHYDGIVRVSAFRDSETPKTAHPVWTRDFKLHLPESTFPRATLSSAWEHTTFHPSQLNGVSGRTTEDGAPLSVVRCKKTMDQIRAETVSFCGFGSTIALVSPHFDDCALLLTIQKVVNKETGEALTIFQDRVWALRGIQIFCDAPTLVQPIAPGRVPTIPEDVQDEFVSTCCMQNDAPDMVAQDPCRKVIGSDVTGTSFPLRTKCGSTVCFHHRSLHASMCRVCRASVKHPCEVCNKPTSSRCQACTSDRSTSTTWYCSLVCQKAHWSKHRLTCQRGSRNESAVGAGVSIATTASQVDGNQ